MIALRAQRSRKFAAHMPHRFRPGALVKVVDVLRDDQRFARGPFRLQSSQGAVGFVRFRFPTTLPAQKRGRTNLASGPCVFRLAFRNPRRIPSGREAFNLPEGGWPTATPTASARIRKYDSSIAGAALFLAPGYHIASIVRSRFRDARSVSILPELRESCLMPQPSHAKKRARTSVTRNCPENAADQDLRLGKLTEMSHIALSPDAPFFGSAMGDGDARGGGKNLDRSVDFPVADAYPPCRGSHDMQERAWRMESGSALPMSGDGPNERH